MARYLFSAVMLLSILFGLALPDVALIWGGYLTIFLAFLMFFATLKVEKNQLERVSPKELLALLFFVFILMPLFSLPFKLSGQLTFIGVLTAFSSPSAAATAFFASFLAGNIALAVAISFISSLLATLTMPLTIWALVGQAVPVDQVKIFTILIEVIVVPTVLAVLFKKAFRKATEKINRHRDYQLAVTFLLNSGVLGVSYGVVKGNEGEFLVLTAEILALLLMSGALAYLFGKRYGKEAAVTFFIATAVKNAILSFAIILALFGTVAILPMVANFIAQSIVLVLFEVFGRRS